MDRENWSYGTHAAWDIGGSCSSNFMKFDIQALGVEPETSSGAGLLDLPIEAEAGGQVLAALSAASSVCSHLDFYTWLQTEVRRIFPHRSLFSAWGDFSTGDINYDVASTVPGLSTRNVARMEGLKQALCRLHALVTESGQFCVKLYDPPATAPAFSWDEPACSGARKLPHGHSSPRLIAYAMHDERGNCDTIYIFTISETQRDVDPALLNLIMPHVDAALRRVRCLDIPSICAAVPGLDDLSGREREVMHWVSEGKSNQEIGAILGISYNTVKNHLKRIFNKLGVTSRSQAVRLFVQGEMSAA